MPPLQIQSPPQAQQQQQVRSQNEKMQQLIESYLQEIQQQKQQNIQHQNQIESLLKFNQRLLYIIQNEVANRRDADSLMPISERSQRESDLINPINSLIKTKRTLAAKSQKGARSVTDHHTSYLKRLEQLGVRNVEHSEFLRSEDQDDESYIYSHHNKSTNYRQEAIQNDKKYHDLSMKIEAEISNEMKNFQQCVQKNKSFYSEKINQLQKLREKISQNKPEDKFNQINNKVKMSPGTANLVKKAMMKRKEKL